jgi:hypothetical protein
MHLTSEMWKTATLKPKDDSSVAPSVSPPRPSAPTPEPGRDWGSIISALKPDKNSLKYKQQKYWEMLSAARDDEALARIEAYGKVRENCDAREVLPCSYFEVVHVIT